MAAKTANKKTQTVTAAFDEGSDPDVPVRPGTGRTTSVYITLDSADNMGWTLNPDPDLKPPAGTTVIWIPEDAAWALDEDWLTKRMYIDIDDVMLKGMTVKGLMDENGQDAPSTLLTKNRTPYEIVLQLKRIVA